MKNGRLQSLRTSEDAGVRFLGTELFCQEGRWWMTHTNYTIDLLTRNLGPEIDRWCHRKLPMFADPETRILPTIREAQRVVGELVWVATRNRPDLAFTINRLASLISKDLQEVIDLPKQVWGYLAATIHQGLLFENPCDSWTSTPTPVSVKFVLAATW